MCIRSVCVYRSNPRWFLGLFAALVLAGAPLAGCSDDSDGQADSTILADAGAPDSGQQDQMPLETGTDSAEPQDDTGTDAAELISVANEKPCPGIVGCWTNDEVVPGSQWVAIRLTPPSYPFTVKKLRYELMFLPDFNLVTEMNHKVELYISQDIAPSASPVVLASIDVEGIATEDAMAIYEIDVDTSVVLQQDDHLFVLVELVADSEGLATCLAACYQSTVEDRNYLSSGGEPPYEWVPQPDGFSFTVEMLGN